MRTFLLLMATAISLLMTSSVRSQPSGCSSASTYNFQIRDGAGRVVWDVPEMECVEYFNFTVSTPHGTRTIKGIGDINVDTFMPAGGMAAIEDSARVAAERLSDLGDYKISDITILITGVASRASTLTEIDGAGVWKHSRTAGSASFSHTAGEGQCPIRVFALNPMDNNDLAMVVAHEMFHCVQYGSLRPDQVKFSTAWWREGSAEMFATHVYPHSSERFSREAAFSEAIEAQEPLFRMSYEALFFFLWHNEHTGIEGVMPLLHAMPASASDSAQKAALRSILANEQWLQFAQDYDDRKIRYPNGSFADFGELIDGHTWSITTTSTLHRTLKPFVIMPGWADYECGIWGNQLNPSETNISVKPSDDQHWQKWPTETDCRDKGSERYRTMAMSTVDGNVALSLRAERRVACEQCLTGETVIDACMVGTWEQTGGGPLEWLSRQPGVPPINAGNMGRLRISMRDDGTFTTQPVGINYDMNMSDRDGTIYNSNRGQIAASAGRWSAERGELRACFDSGGQSSTVATAVYPPTIRNPSGLTGSGSFFGPGYGGTGGATQYTCSDNSLETRISMPRGGDMVYRFTRVSARP